MPKQKQKNNKKSKETKTNQGSGDLFMLQEKVESIDSRVRSIYRWVMWQRVVFGLKVLIIILAALGVVSLFNKYTPIIKDYAVKYGTELQSFTRIMEGLEKPKVEVVE